jgi:hypothetical protein
MRRVGEEGREKKGGRRRVGEEGREKKDGRRRTGEEGREKDGRTEEGRMDGRAGGRAEGRTDGRRTGGEFREKRRAMGKEVVRFWSSKKTKEVEFGIRGRFDLNKVCGSK